MELERKLEDRCCGKIEKLGGAALKIKVFGLRGFPDRLVLLPARVAFFIEFKRPKKGRVAATQVKWRRMLTKLGFPFYIIDNDEDFDAALAQERRP